jgi:tetratricopeptide (TPR) repeat protein
MLTLSDKGEVDRAIQDYNKAIDLNSEDATAYNNRGSACAHKGDLDAAIQDYSKAIDLNPEDAAAYYNRGIAYS